jgi:hypothetical protein
VNVITLPSGVENAAALSLDKFEDIWKQIINVYRGGILADW